MSEKEKAEVWEYIIELALQSASRPEKNVFDAVKAAKASIEIPDILK